MPDLTGLPVSGFDTVLGLVFDEVRTDGVVAHLDVAPHLLQPYGILHGGVLASVVESVGSVAAAAWFGDRGQVVGTHNATDFVRAVREGTLTARAEPVHCGRTQQLWTIRITDAQDRLIAKGELRVANLATAEAIGH